MSTQVTPTNYLQTQLAMSSNWFISLTVKRPTNKGRQGYRRRW